MEVMIFKHDQIQNVGNVNGFSKRKSKNQVATQRNGIQKILSKTVMQ